MFLKPSRLTTVTLAAASIVGSGLSVDPVSAAPATGGVSVSDTQVQGVDLSATQAAAGDTLNVAAVSAAISTAANGSVGYAFRISQGGQPVGGGAGGHARRPLDGTRDMDGTPFTVDTRIEVKLPAIGELVPAGKSSKARRAALAKVNARVLTPAGVKATTCKGGFGSTAAHIYNAQNLTIGGTLVSPAGSGDCGPRRGLLLSATDLVLLAPALTGGIGGSLGGWTTAAGQSDDGLVSWQSGDGEFPGGREIHTCLASAAGHDLSMIFNAQTPGDASPCRILLDAINASRTAS